MSFGEFVGFVCEPYIAEIGEECAFEDGEDGEAVFEVCDELDVADTLKHIVAVALVVAWSEVSQVPSPDGGWSASEEAFFVGHSFRVAVGESDAGEKACDEGAFASEVEIMFVFGVESDVLREWDSDDLTDIVVVGLAVRELADGGEDVACAFDREVEIVEVGAFAIAL